MRALALTMLVLGACGAPTQPVASREPAPIPAPRVALDAADEAWLDRLPDDTFLIVRLDHAVLSESPYHGALVGDEALLVEAALGGHLDRAPEQTLPAGLLRDAQMTTFIVTLDDVGMDDSFTVITGGLDDATVAALLAQARNLTNADGSTARLGPATDDGVEAVCVFRAGAGLAFGPADRERELRFLLDGRESPAEAPEFRALLARTSGSRGGAHALLANTRALSDYLREALTQQNLTPEIVDMVIGFAASLDVRDGAVLKLTAYARDNEAAELLADQLDELLAGLEEYPVITAMGLSRVIAERTTSVEGAEVQFVLRTNDETFRTLLVRMLSALASAGTVTR